VQKLVRKASTPEQDWMAHAVRIGSILAARKSMDIRAYDLRELTLVADCFILASAASAPQFKAILHSVKDEMKEGGVSPYRIEGDVSGSWLVIDYGSVVVHIFREEARGFYDLDGLWADAPEIDLDLDLDLDA